MPELVEHDDQPRVALVPDDLPRFVDEPPPTPPPEIGVEVFEGDEKLARSDLRRQIARLEAELAALFGDAFPRNGIEFGVAAPGRSPRILQLDELEELRDSLAVRLQHARGELTDRAYVEQCNRELLESLVANPGEYHWLRISNEDIGEPGCRHWHSRPRWGLLGMLMGWWRVKLSSGCPLAEGPAPRPR